MEGFMLSVFKVLRRAPRPPYSEKWYWDKVYFETRGRILEWGDLDPKNLVEYKWSRSKGDAFMREQSKGKLEEHVGLKDDVLVLGCGNSVLSDTLRECGWKGKITSMDLSSDCIHESQARAEAKGLKNMHWLTADVRDLHQHVPASSFDVALDKGMLDAMYCSEKSDTVIPGAKDSVLRVLKPGGRWVCIMNGGMFGMVPPTHLDHLIEDYRWNSLHIRRIAPMDLGLYLYVWTKSSKFK